jgi:beta-glucosidase
VVAKEPTDLPAAVTAARNADVVILAVGGRSAWSNERTEGEGSDTANKDLPPQQVELINAVTALGNLPSQGLMKRLGMTRREDLDFIDERFPADSEVNPQIVYRIDAGDWPTARAAALG